VIILVYHKDCSKCAEYVFTIRPLAWQN